MRRRVMTVAMATFFAGMMVFSDVEIYADQEVTTEIENMTEQTEETEQNTTEATTEVISKTTAEHNTTDIVNKRKKKQRKKRKERRKEEKKNHTTKKAKKKSVTEQQITSQNHIKIDPKDQREYLGSYLYFNQGDSIWNNNNLSIRSAGCGPSAVAVCISNLTHKLVTPVDTAEWAKNEGYYSVSGSLHSAIPAMANHWNLECKGLYKNKDKIEKALRSGHMVVGLMGPGYFTQKGHFIALLGINKKGQIEVADVGSRERSKKVYDLDFIIDNSKFADAGGPFWELWNSKVTINNSKKEKRRKKIIKKQLQTVDQNKQEIIRKFYLNLQAELTDFEKEIPMEELLLGVKDQTVQIHKSKINVHLKHLGEQLNDQKLIKISESYSFGMDAMQLYKEKTYFALPKYLENITRIN